MKAVGINLIFDYQYSRIIMNTSEITFKEGMPT